MKKSIAIILSFIMVITCGVVFTSCSKKAPEKEKPHTGNTAQNEIVGGYEQADSPVITDEFMKLFQKACEKLDGVNYTPVAYLASQVVAGTNHRVLCKAQSVVPDAVPTYAILTIYEDLEGNAEITDIINSTADADYPEGLSGAWSETATPTITNEVKQALEKACETLTGAEYTPVALLATQVVAGSNYRILCQSKATVPNAQPYYVIITVYADLEGNAEILETTEFENEESTDAAQIETSEASDSQTNS